MYQVIRIKYKKMFCIRLNSLNNLIKFTNFCDEF